MYIYLSDRKRRLYLSQASPQNLSPKRNLSRKDRRFLQKNVANIQDSLSVRLVKQQKVLYSKHIGSLIEPRIFSKKTEGFALQSKQLPLQSTTFSFCDTSSTGSSKGLALQSKSSAKLTKSSHKTTSFTLQSKHKKPTNVYAFSALSVYVQPIKTYTENTFTDIQKKSALHVKKNMYTPIEGFAATTPFPSFVLHGEKSNFALAPSKAKQAMRSKQDLTMCALQSKQSKQSTNKQNQPRNVKRENEGVLKACLHMPFLAFSICRTLASPPLYTNGKSSYFYSRYLYNIESLKTCIMPQVLQNQKTASRYKYILHERKKLALLYGQLAKKDMQTLIKNANALPGLFEDNVFALLESRVDVLVHRAGFSNSIAGARQLIRNGMFYINGKKICSCKTRAFPGDFLALCSAKPKKREGLLYKAYIHTTEALYNLYTESSPLAKASLLDYKAPQSQTAGVALQSTNLLPLQKQLKDSSKPKIDSKKQPTLYESLFFYKNLCKKESLPWLAVQSQELATGKAKAKALLCKEQENVIHKKAQQKSTDLTVFAMQLLCDASKQKQKQAFNFSSLESRTNETSKAKVFHSTEKSYKISAYQTFPYMETEKDRTVIARISAFTKSLRRKGLLYKGSTPRLLTKASKALPYAEQALLPLERQLLCNSTYLLTTCKASAQQSKGGSKQDGQVGSKHFNTEKTGLWCSRLLNSCGAYILKYKAKQRQVFLAAVGKEVVFHKFMKNIQNANSASIWGQKPLHLEISHKRGAFIYMYTPQKIIFPVSLDLHAIKGSY